MNECSSLPNDYGATKDICTADAENGDIVMLLKKQHMNIIENQALNRQRLTLFSGDFIIDRYADFIIRKPYTS